MLYAYPEAIDSFRDTCYLPTSDPIRVTFILWATLKELYHNRDNQKLLNLFQPAHFQNYANLASQTLGTAYDMINFMVILLSFALKLVAT